MFQVLNGMSRLTMYFECMGKELGLQDVADMFFFMLLMQRDSFIAPGICNTSKSLEKRARMMRMQMP